MTHARCRLCSETRRHWRRIFWLFLTLALLAPVLFGTFPLTVSAAEDPPPDGNVRNVLLINLENNLTLYEKAADTPVYPSSSVKIMTGLLACRALADRLDEEVTLTAAMLSGVEGRRMNPPLADGEVIFRTESNYQRLIKLPVDRKLKVLTLRPLTTYGAEKANVFSFDFE